MTLILSDTYGPGGNHRKVLNLIRHTAQAKESLTLSDGQQDYDVGPIDDVVRAFQLAGKASRAGAGNPPGYYKISNLQT